MNKEAARAILGFIDITKEYFIGTPALKSLPPDVLAFELGRYVSTYIWYTPQ